MLGEIATKERESAAFRCQKDPERDREKEKGRRRKKQKRKISNKIPRTRWPLSYDWMKRETWKQGRRSDAVAYVPSGYIALLSTHALSLSLELPMNTATNKQRTTHTRQRDIENGPKTIQAGRRTSLGSYYRNYICTI